MRGYSLSHVHRIFYLSTTLAVASLLRCGGGVRYDDLGGAPLAPDDAKPALLAISPAKGAWHGGTSVTVEGSQFSANVSVEIGGVACAVTGVSGDRIQCTTAKKVPGVVDVTVKNPASETTTLIAAYTYFSRIYLASASSDSLYGFTIDPSGGGLEAITGSPFITAATTNALVVEPSGKFLFALNNALKIESFAIDPLSGALTGTASPTSLSGGPTHAVATPNAKFLYALGSGFLSAFAIESNGGTTLIQDSSGGPSFLAMTPSGGFLYAAQGSTIAMFRIGQGGSLTSLGNLGLSGSFSPNSLAVDPSERFVYATNSNENRVAAIRIKEDGTLANDISGSPFQLNTGIPNYVACEPGGKYIYILNSSSQVQALAIKADGGLDSTGMGGPYSSGVTTKAIVIDPAGKFLFVNDSGSNNLVEFSIEGTGQLNNIGPISIGTPSAEIVID